MAHRAEDVFDAGPWCGDTPVALLLCLGDRFAGAAFALDMNAPARLRQCRFALCARVTAVGMHVARLVLFRSSRSSKTVVSATAALVMITLRTSLWRLSMLA